jgi:diphosphoinositol-polyphosphate diphosphatase
MADDDLSLTSWAWDRTMPSTKQQNAQMTAASSVRNNHENESKSPYKAGGVVYRATRNGHEILLVTSRSRPGRWILPKGSAESGEHAVDTATREIAEEAGVRGRLLGKLGIVKRPNQAITFFLYEFRDDVAWSENRIRERRWVELKKAERYLRQTDLHEIVLAARRMLGLA